MNIWRISQSRPFCIYIGLFLFSSLLNAQISGHQRLGVETKTIIELMPTLSVQVTPDNTLSSAGFDLITTATVEAVFHDTYLLIVSVPYNSWVNLGLATNPQAVSVLGDSYFSLGDTFRTGDWRMTLAGYYVVPTGIWNPYEVAMLQIRSGSGYHTLGISFSAKRFLDPLIAGFTITGETGLSRAERFGSSVMPLNAYLSGYATEALNEHVAISISLKQAVYFPLIYDGIPDSGGVTYSLTGNVSIFFSADSGSFSVDISKNLFSNSSPVSLALSYTYSFRMKEKKNE